MTAPLAKERLRHAHLLGCANGMRGAIRNGDDPAREERHRVEWPELWARIDALTGFVDW